MTTAKIQQHNCTVLKNLQIGDLVEFPRGVYSHWAVYVGDGKVIHLAGDESCNAEVSSGSVFTICGMRFRKAFVKIDDFWDVVCGSKAYKNNDKDKRWRPSDVAEIIGRARKMIGEIEYNVLWSNCEHFASYCRYGRHKSDQTDTFLTWTAATLCVLAAGISGLIFGSATEKKKEKKEAA